MATLQASSRRATEPPLDLRDRLIVLALTVSLTWGVWCFGGMSRAAIIGLLLLSCATFSLLFVPFGVRSRSTPGDAVRRLVRAPLFWIGLCLVAYIAVQVLNARFTLVRPPEGGIRLLYNAFLDYLPSGLVAPLDMDSSLRGLMMWASGWLLACTVWAGLWRRAHHRVLLWIISGSALVFSCVGVAERATQSAKYLWLVNSGVKWSHIWGVLPNRNHAAAFLNLGLIATLFSLLDAYSGGRREFLKGNPHLLLVVPALGCLAGVVNTASRAGMIVAALITLVFLAVVLWKIFVAVRADRRNLAVLGVILAVIGIGLGGAASTIDRRALIKRWGDTEELMNNPETELRYYINQATVDLFRLRPTYGWGMDTYTYFIRTTQFNYEPLRKLALNPNKKLRRKIGFAHNDYLQWLTELGWVGFSFIALAAGWALWKMGSRLPRTDAAGVFAMISLCCFMLHPLVEFFFYRPAVFTAFAVIAVSLLRLIDLKAAARQRLSRRQPEEPLAAG